jgi:hypothetical protein
VSKAAAGCCCLVDVAAMALRPARGTAGPLQSEHSRVVYMLASVCRLFVVFGSHKRTLGAAAAVLGSRVLLSSGVELPQ